MQSANTVVMVRPTQFGFNEETATDNEFQNKVSLPSQDVRERALDEFSGAVATLRDNGIEVLVMEENPTLGKLPDAIFPNNWFSTDSKGFLYIYPMSAENRRKEVRVDELKRLLVSGGFNIQGVVDFRELAQNDLSLEGTGSFVFDHQNRIAYLAVSGRSDLSLAETVCEQMDYELVSFTSLSSGGVPFYHTNVVMSVGSKWAVICFESIQDQQERTKVYNALANAELDVIDISQNQTQNSFCGNILEVRNEDNQLFAVMSQCAFEGFSEEQKEVLAGSSTILPIAIPTIEKIGGGSMRCTMAEIFLPYSN